MSLTVVGQAVCHPLLVHYVEHGVVHPVHEGEQAVGHSYRAPRDVGSPHRNELEYAKIKFKSAPLSSLRLYSVALQHPGTFVYGTR